MRTMGNSRILAWKKPSSEKATPTKIWKERKNTRVNSKQDGELASLRRGFRNDTEGGILQGEGDGILCSKEKESKSNL